MIRVTFWAGESDLAKLRTLKKQTKLNQSAVLRGLIRAVTVPTNEGQKNSDASRQASHVAISQ